MYQENPNDIYSVRVQYSHWERIINNILRLCMIFMSNYVIVIMMKYEYEMGQRLPDI